MTACPLPPAPEIKSLPLLGVIAAAALVPVEAYAAPLTPVWSDNEDGRAHLWPGVEPSYTTTLAMEVDDGTSTETMTQWSSDGMTAPVWLTPDLGAGSHSLRWRWVVDGVDGDWSAAETVTVTDTDLATTTSLAWDDPTMNADTAGSGDDRIVVTLEDAVTGDPVPFGRFVDGEPYVVAANGIKVTAETPTTTTPTLPGGYSATLNASAVDCEVGAQGLMDAPDSTDSYDATKAYTLSDTISAGSVYLKSAAETTPTNTDNMQMIATITVLSSRPPAGSFRPAVHGSATKRLLNVASLNLGLVPRLPAASSAAWTSGGGDAEFDNFHVRAMRYPAPPLAAGSAGSRAMFPENTASQYHRTIREDWAMAGYYALSSNLSGSATVSGPDGVSRTRRELAAIALVQRMIDHIGGGESHVAEGGDITSATYHWSTASALAGTIIQDPTIRNASHWGLVNRDYVFDGRNTRGSTVMSVATAIASTGGYDPDSAASGQSFDYRDADAAGTDWAGGDVVFWGALLSPRTIDFPSDHADAAKLEAMGITNNGDDTWTIPANRASTGWTLYWDRSATGFPDGDAFLVEPQYGDYREGDGVTGEHMLEAALRIRRYSDANTLLSPAPDPDDPGLPDATAFLNGRDGFRLDGPDYGSPVVAGAGQTGTSLDISGLTGEPQVGDWIAIRDDSDQGYHLDPDDYWGCYRVTAVSSYDGGAGTATLTLDTGITTAPPDGKPVEFVGDYADNPHYTGGTVNAGEQTQANWWARGYLKAGQPWGKVIGTDAVPNYDGGSDKLGDAIYTWQHAPQVPLFAPLLKALPSTGYLNADSDLVDDYLDFGLQWMRTPGDWPLACGWSYQASYPMGGTVVDEVRVPGAGKYEAPDKWAWVDDLWFAAFDQTAPVLTATVPDAPRVQDVTIAVSENTNDLDVTIDGIGHDGWSPVTDLEYSLNGGDWTSAAISAPGESATVTGLAEGSNDLDLRFVNAVGASAATAFTATYTAPAGVLVEDGFDRADGNVAGSTPDVADVGTTWAGADGFTFDGYTTNQYPKVASNQFYRATTFGVGIIDCLQADVALSADYTNSANKQVGLIARWTDNQNYVGLIVDDFQSRARLFEVVAGVQNVFDTIASPALTGTMTLTVSGTSVSADVNGSEITGTLDAGLTGTTHGLGARDAYLDNWTCTAP